MKRKVHFKFHSKSSVTITSFIGGQKTIDLKKIDNGSYIDLIKLGKKYDAPNDDTRFMGQVYHFNDDDGNYEKTQIDIWYRVKAGEKFINVGSAGLKWFFYRYKNMGNSTVEETTDGTFEVTILD